MTKAANCKKCGELFIQTSKREICDSCFEKLNIQIADMNNYVLEMSEPTIELESLLQKFGMKRAEFDELYAAGKFVKIAQRVTMVCTGCRHVVTLVNKTGPLCPACIKKLQNEL